MNYGDANSPLSAAIRAEIAASGRAGVAEDGRELSAISFHQYMTHCLYHPEFGYYRSGTSRVGRDGDFYTSAYVGDAMGAALAARLAQLAAERFGEGEFVEIVDWGGGTGRLSRHMLDAWNEAETDVSRFRLTVVESNPVHRAAAAAELRSYLEAGRAAVASPEEWEGSRPERLREAPAIVVANELLDAFPVHLLEKNAGRVRERGVAWDEGGRFVPCLLKETDPRLEEWLRGEGAELREGQTVEANVDGAAWAAGLASRFRNGLLVVIDYGDETEELFASHRMNGTLRGYRGHRAYDDPYAFPGEQDLTAHVNFSHLRRELGKAGATEIWYGTQKRFLVESGLLGRLQAHALSDPFHPIVRRNRAIRQLLLSDGMSELFKVQIFAFANE
ncbi:class I SAM-dependent methyltransferase [Paenibacillaceae bacterium WGS1546]|uniref:class I SAM-dependent methyltransferase n=1 Tax=Cohnella sp. WGS1546 TaxID=3366810 RepID=UPI00372D3702